MAEHASSKQGRLWLILLGALVVAVVSLLALLQWDSPARATERAGSVSKIALKPSGGSFDDHLAEATGEGDFQAQIVGGKAVPNGKYPFMAILIIEDNFGNPFLCGGSLIDKNSVLTAAHCFFNSSGNLDVVAVDVAVGRTVRSMQSQGVDRFATDLYWPTRYNPSGDNRYDAAVLKLHKAVNGIKPIKLATAKQNSLEQPGRSLTVAGWGDTSEGGSSSNRMREVSVPVVSDTVAQRAYGPGVYFPKLMVAAGKKGKDSCQGDSGGPMFNPGATSTTQVGIVSFGRGCARAGFPGVYTEVNNPGIRSFIVGSAQQ